MSPELLKPLERRLVKILEPVAGNPSVKHQIFEATNKEKRLSTLRLWSEDEEAMTTAKVAVENLLHGTVVMENKKALWDSWFCSSGGTTFLDEMSEEYDIYCSVDRRKRQLVIYGVTEELKLDIERQFHEKVANLPSNYHNILIPDDIPNRGTLHSIRERFGESVTFFLHERPKRIFLRGTADDVKFAENLLRQGPSGDHGNGVTVCLSCGDPPTDTLKTTCGHVYCQECFEHMANSATDDLPLYCRGMKEDGEACSHVFQLVELEKVLPLANFEKL